LRCAISQYPPDYHVERRGRRDCEPATGPVFWPFPRPPAEVPLKRATLCSQPTFARIRPQVRPGIRMSQAIAWRRQQAAAPSATTATAIEARSKPRGIIVKRERHHSASSRCARTKNQNAVVSTTAIAQPTRCHRQVGRFRGLLAVIPDPHVGGKLPIYFGPKL
jgi:hypothetical protein